MMDLSLVRITALVSLFTMAARTLSMMVLVSFQFEPLSGMKSSKGMTLVYKLLNNPASLGSCCDHRT